MSDEQFSGGADAVRIKFLLTELELALAFMDVAAATRIRQNAQRGHLNALIAYDTVLELLRNCTLSAVQQHAFDGKLALLKARLQAVGML